MRIAYTHMHSVYSIKDAIAQPVDYVKAIHEYNRNSKEHEIVALAITEHGNAYSTILHHESCVNPIKGDPEKRTLKHKKIPDINIGYNSYYSYSAAGVITTS